jgi:hypothetical protein
MTATEVREGFGNRLLRRLSQSDADLLAPYLRPVELKLRQQLETASHPIREGDCRRVPRAMVNYSSVRNGLANVA